MPPNIHLFSRPSHRLDVATACAPSTTKRQQRDLPSGTTADNPNVSTSATTERIVSHTVHVRKELAERWDHIALGEIADEPSAAGKVAERATAFGETARMQLARQVEPG